MKIDVLSVAELLKASRKAHEAYRRAAGAIDKFGTIVQTTNDAMCADALKVARDYRTEAHERDKHHQDPAWSLDRVPHEQLMRFYESYLR